MNQFELIFTYYDGTQSQLSVSYCSDTPPNRVYLNNLARTLHRRRDLMTIKVIKYSKHGSIFTEIWIYSQVLGAFEP